MRKTAGLLVGAAVLMFLLAGCHTDAPAPESAGDSAVESSREEITLVSIVDLTEVNHMGTDSAMEQFYQDDEYTYFFPSIKSEYIECHFSDGSTMKIAQALASGKVSVSALDQYGILYWIEDESGAMTRSPEKGDGVRLTPEDF